MGNHSRINPRAETHVRCGAHIASHPIRSGEPGEDVGSLTLTFVYRNSVRTIPYEAKRYKPVFISGLGYLTGPSAYLVSISGGRIVRAAAGAAADQHPGGAILLLTVYS